VGKRAVHCRHKGGTVLDKNVQCCRIQCCTALCSATWLDADGDDEHDPPCQSGISE
jgi:hypothetical protein